ncbi:hypothetical protein C7M61_001394 [Candidozyma pseudohaemuli]|uniref:amidase n=1 Tax=Candidozyma pseudohaemuli TaxID=418784 RepID=A0A2P7YUG5_9ASCO|nr:hypothetical protein C7M61_001394 [[Candida] pseudohaemulonii]PSK39595.1 hypothetical protein C7M61_001394 [[Candida] pseudohaemulonii]
MVSYKDFLTTDALDTYEDNELYTKEFLPRLEKYRSDLENAIKKEYLIQVPKSAEALAEEQFNALQYLYDEKLLTEKEFEITDSSSSRIVNQIAKGAWSAVEVFKAFAKRATIAHQLTNCALELFTDEGLERAQYLDDYYAKNGKTVGPLHGLPISLKEQMNYKGKITHGGYVSHIVNIPEKHAPSAEILEKLGAVFYVRTNQPQTLMHLCGNNNFIGWSKCPYNVSLTAGGSSSGEGAITAFGGSSIGIGSDIGGSIRGPAAFSGSVGLRPTTSRFSKAGGVSSAGGQESVPAVQGPLARSIDDIDMLMDVYVNQGQPWTIDCTTIPIPWRKVEKPKPENLTVAIAYDDGIVSPTPPILRGLKHVADKLKAAGVKVIEHKPLRTEFAYELVNKMYSADGNYKQRKLLAGSGEPLCKLTKWSLNYGEGSREFGVAENRQMSIDRDLLKQQYTDYLNENNIDMLISPAFVNVAPKPETAYVWSYTTLFNLIDFPTLAFQTGLYQDPKLDKWDPKPAARTKLEELEHDQYDPEQFKNAPIALQLTGRRYFDEEVVAAGKTIVDILKVDLLKHH